MMSAEPTPMPSEGQLPEQRSSKRLRPLLIKLLDTGELPGLEWEDRKEKTWRLPWRTKRTSRPEDQDGVVIQEIARHMYPEGVSLTKAKERLRNALRSLKDIVQISKDSEDRPFKVYQFLEEKPRHSQRHHQNSSQRMMCAASHSVPNCPDLESPHFLAPDYEIQNIFPSVHNIPDILQEFDDLSSLVSTSSENFRSRSPMETESSSQSEDSGTSLSDLSAVNGNQWWDDLTSSQHQPDVCSDFASPEQPKSSDSCIPVPGGNVPNFIEHDFPPGTDPCRAGSGIQNGYAVEAQPMPLPEHYPEQSPQLPACQTREGQGETLLTVCIYYHVHLVKTVFIRQSSFSIYHGFLQNHDKNQQNIKLPESDSCAKLSNEQREVVNEVLTKIKRGIKFSIPDSLDIFATRFCKARVVSQILPDCPRGATLVRSVETKIFNYAEGFVPRLDNYTSSLPQDSVKPKEYVTLSLGGEYGEITDRPDIVRVQIWHKRAEQLLNEIQNDLFPSRAPEGSKSDCYDMVMHSLEKISINS